MLVAAGSAGGSSPAAGGIPRPAGVGPARRRPRASRILERLVGLGDFLEARLGLRLLGNVRMVFLRQSPVGLLDLVLRSAALDTERGVVVAVLHRTSARFIAPAPWATASACSRRESRTSKPGWPLRAIPSPAFPRRRACRSRRLAGAPGNRRPSTCALNSLAIMPDNMGTDFAISSKIFAKLANTAWKFSLPGSAEYGTTQICSSSWPSRVTSQTLQARPLTVSDLPVSATSTVCVLPCVPMRAAHRLLQLRALLGRQLGHLLLHLVHRGRQLLARRPPSWPCRTRCSSCRCRR